MENRYTIMFEGEILSGADRDTVKRNLSQLLKADSEQMEKMFSGNPVVIKRNVDAVTTEKYRAAFEKAGALCVFKPDGESEENSSGNLMIEEDAAATEDSPSEPPTSAVRPVMEVKTHFTHTAYGGDMIVTNIETVPGKAIVEHFGLVSGSTIRAKHIGRDFMAGLKNLVGGELKGYTELLQESRREAMERMVGQADQLGANAIVNVRFSTSSVAQGAAELYAYGTAVRVD